MTYKNVSRLAIFLVATLAFATMTPPLAGRGGGDGGGRGGGGGGARGGGGMGGGGMGGGARSAPRPSMGPSGSNFAARSTANFSRPQPSVSRPSFSQLNNPSARPTPSPTPRPSMGITNPYASAGQSITRPSVAQRPSMPSVSDNRPSLGNVSRPSVSSPGIATRPATGIDRPGFGDRPGIGERPGTGDRPIIGGGNRPGGGDRPIIGGRNNIVNRPGGGNAFVNINNRPGWGLGDGGHGNWGDRWYNHNVPSRYHGWYHGCWNGHWGNYWWAGAAIWGLNALLPSWGYAYGDTYSNPYYVESAAPVYDYSQPIVVNNYDTEPASDAAAAPAESPQAAEAYQLFDQALAAFKQGDYPGALTLDQRALRISPQDPVMHEVSALCMFATGDYQSAAAVLDNLLAVAPGMDWTTLSGLYGDVQQYTVQLRALEAYSVRKPDDAAAHFVLAYHYLVAGYNDAAAEQLKRVVAAQPADQVAARMLAALTPPAETPAAANQPAAVAPAATPAAAPAATAPASAPAGPTTDLVGVWRAERNSDAFDLSIDENNQFTWKAAPKGQPPVTLTGTMAVAGDAILLQSKDQGTMAAQVKSAGADQFQFIAAGSPPNDPGLSFQRVQ